MTGQPCACHVSKTSSIAGCLGFDLLGVLHAVSSRMASPTRWKRMTVDTSALHKALVCLDFSQSLLDSACRGISIRSELTNTQSITLHCGGQSFHPTLHDRVSTIIAIRIRVPYRQSSLASKICEDFLRHGRSKSTDQIVIVLCVLCLHSIDFEFLSYFCDL